ncbi:unnamed protein product [Peronospora belbahrii]|uniref:Uncharacterized protein n=1 Tax=Peronospora belbahrii TaxID=622444 RepID=A0AAU9KSM9_9STRA|nr:unnamed protein product [Peronospora belbahrii]CAH0521557.1 unnamed protein product [Peronospora belbahrii]
MPTPPSIKITRSKSPSSNKNPADVTPATTTPESKPRNLTYVSSKTYLPETDSPTTHPTYSLETPETYSLDIITPNPNDL